MKLKITTWNINSVRLRIGLLEDLVRAERPDIIALQETKVRDELFPKDALVSMGYPHVTFRGEKGYNGVAILAKLPFTETRQEDFGGKPESRHICAHFEKGFSLHNFYVPAGGDEPDPVANPKYQYKLDFVDDMRQWFTQENSNIPQILVGDLNIAPLEHDVWSHKQLRNVVSHTEPEITRLQALQQTSDWVDVGRVFVPEDEKLYSWWSYRNRDWKKSNRGRRLDHIWVSPNLKKSLEAYSVLSEARDWTKPSDHVPVNVVVKI